MSPLFELARLLVCFDHVASFIVAEIASEPVNRRLAISARRGISEHSSNLENARCGPASGCWPITRIIPNHSAFVTYEAARTLVTPQPLSLTGSGASNAFLSQMRRGGRVFC